MKTNKNVRPFGSWAGKQVPTWRELTPEKALPTGDKGAGKDGVGGSFFSLGLLGWHGRAWEAGWAG